MADERAEHIPAAADVRVDGSDDLEVVVPDDHRVAVELGIFVPCVDAVPRAGLDLEAEEVVQAVIVTVVVGPRGIDVASVDVVDTEDDDGVIDVEVR